MNIPFITDAKLESAASQLRWAALAERARDRRVDLEALVFDHLCEQDTLSIQDDQELPDEGGCEVLGKTDFPRCRIQLNARLKRNGDTRRLRFTLAHEVGHWVLHRPFYLGARAQGALFAEPVSDGVITTLARDIVSPRAPRPEIQANRFAAWLLIDTDLLADEVRLRHPHGVRGDRPSTAMGLREWARSVASDGSAGRASLADSFDVSIEAMAIALETRGFLVPAGTLFSS